MKQADNLVLSKPLSDAKKDPIYITFQQRAGEVKLGRGRNREKLDAESVNIISNYAYLLYELLEINRRREVDYLQVKEFALEYNTVFDYIFDEQLPLLNKLHAWLKEDVDLTEMGMYLPTTSLNKNIYH